MMSPRVLASLLGTSLWLGLAAFVPGCGGGGGGGDAAATTGTESNLQIALADGPADEIDRFEVDIVRIELVRRNGALVEALPVELSVDFTEVIEVAELIHAASVPNGAYDRVSLTIDFSTASVHLVGADSDATLLDENGEPLDDEVTLAVEFERGNPLVIAPGRPRILTIDFDLDASVTVDIDGNTVTVAPVLVADIDLQRPHIHRVRGALTEVNVDRSLFRLDLRPFRAATHRFGSINVRTDAETHFEIDGVCYEGGEGLAVMADLPALTAVIAKGRFRFDPVHFVAGEVLAGSSVPGGALDVVRGIVAGRSGDDLTILGAHLDRSGGGVTFDATVTVTLDPGATVVSKESSMDAVTTGDISVGQSVLAFGELSESAGTFTLAPTERVRLLRTKLSASVVEIGDGSLVLDLDRIGRRPVGDLDFTGTGGGGEDADPANYEVDIGALTAGAFTAGDPIEAFGFVAPFGAAPPDFFADTLVEVAAVGAVMAVHWSRDSAVEFPVIEGDRIELDLAGSPVIHHVARGFTLTDLTGFDGVALVPAAETEIFALRDGPTVSVYSDFGDFAAALDERLDDGEHARSLLATGRFDDETGDLSARYARVILRRP